MGLVISVIMIVFSYIGISSYRLKTRNLFYKLNKKPDLISHIKILFLVCTAIFLVQVMLLKFDTDGLRKAINISMYALAATIFIFILLWRNIRKEKMYKTTKVIKAYLILANISLGMLMSFCLIAYTSIDDKSGYFLLYRFITEFLYAILLIFHMVIEFIYNNLYRKIFKANNVEIMFLNKCSIKTKKICYSDIEFYDNFIRIKYDNSVEMIPTGNIESIKILYD